MSELLDPVDRTYAFIFQILDKDNLTPTQDLVILTRLIITILNAAEKQGQPKEKIMQTRKLIAKVIINGVENE